MNDLEQAAERAIESLEQIARDLRREPASGEDRAAYERRVAERLEQIAAELSRPLAVIDRVRGRETERALRLRRT